MTFPDKIIDKIFEYEQYMKEHLPMYKYVLKDIEEGLKIIILDHDWHKRYYSEIDDVFFLQFPWKHVWTQQPLEGAALHIDRGRTVCRKRAPEIKDNRLIFCHPYY